MPLVLLTDDEPGILLAQQRALRGLPCEVRAIPDTGDALAFLGSTRPSLVVTDGRKPCLSGPDFARAVKELHPVPVLLVSASAWMDASVSCDPVFDGGVLFKPWEDSIFVGTVQQVLAGVRRPVLDPARPIVLMTDSRPEEAGRQREALRTLVPRCQPYWIGDPDAAWVLAQSLGPAVVITDWLKAGRDWTGETLAERLRNGDSSRGLSAVTTPILLVTGSAEGWSHSTGNPRFAAALRKPWHPEELARAVEGLLGLPQGAEPRASRALTTSS